MLNSGISSTRTEKNDGVSLTYRGSQAKKSTMWMLPTQKSACPFLTTMPTPSELSGLSYGNIRTHSRRVATVYLVGKTLLAESGLDSCPVGLVFLPGAS